MFLYNLLMSPQYYTMSSRVCKREEERELAGILLRIAVCSSVILRRVYPKRGQADYEIMLATVIITLTGVQSVGMQVY